MVIFVKVEDSEFSPTIFVDLVQLEGQDAETIYTTLLNSLNNVGFDDEYLTNNLIAFCSDGASVMLGKVSGVSARIKQGFPDIILFESSFETRFG